MCKNVQLSEQICCLCECALSHILDTRYIGITIQEDLHWHKDILLEQLDGQCITDDGIPPTEHTRLPSRAEATYFNLLQLSQIMPRVCKCSVGPIHGSRYRCLGESPAAKGCHICLWKLQERGKYFQNAQGARMGPFEERRLHQPLAMTSWIVGGS